MARWQPPPMKSAEVTKVTIDERVVRKMLRVNPELRRGRTTFQVKRALEQGEPLRGDDESAGAQEARPAGSELKEAVGFFVSGKADKLRAKLADIDLRRRALEAEEQRVRVDMGEQVVAFVGLLDDGTVAVHGNRVLSSHADFLAQVGLTPAALLNKARNK